MRGSVPLLLLLFLLPGAQALGPGYPALSIGLSPLDRPVEYSPYDQNITFDGTVAVDNPSGSTVEVYLGGVSPGWSAICSPAILALRDSGLQRFNLTVIVPGGTFNRSVQAWVNGEAHLAGQVVLTNRSPQVSIRVGAQPGGPGTGGGLLGVDYTDILEGRVALSLVAAAIVLAVVAVAGFVMLGRRRRRQGATP